MSLQSFQRAEKARCSCNNIQYYILYIIIIYVVYSLCILYNIISVEMEYFGCCFVRRCKILVLARNCLLILDIRERVSHCLVIGVGGVVIMIKVSDRWLTDFFPCSIARSRVE